MLYPTTGQSQWRSAGFQVQCVTLLTSWGVLFRPSARKATQNCCTRAPTVITSSHSQNAAPRRHIANACMHAKGQSQPRLTLGCLHTWELHRSGGGDVLYLLGHWGRGWQLCSHSSTIHNRGSQQGTSRQGQQGQLVAALVWGLVSCHCSCGRLACCSGRGSRAVSQRCRSHGVPTTSLERGESSWYCTR